MTLASGNPTQIQLRGLGLSDCRPVEQTDDTGMVFVRMCPGTFMMGSAGDDLLTVGGDEYPAHQVTLSREFWIAKYEVRNAEFRLFQSEHQDRFNADDQDEPNLHNLDTWGVLLDQLPRSLLTLAALVGGVLTPLWLSRKRAFRALPVWLMPTLVCTPGSLSQEVGLALGAQAGEGRLREVCLKGGFTRFRRAAETPFNIVLEAKP